MEKIIKIFIYNEKIKKMYRNEPILNIDIFCNINSRKYGNNNPNENIQCKKRKYAQIQRY